ncbi:MAG: methionyl-tRNA formyltransferase [Chloroflexi bacterium]|nr:methionyl-tRNA formyltransferase [Chloroflexota bacterium]
MPSLDALARLASRGVVELTAVVTQPDRPGHRGRIAPSPVKARALELGLDVVQPARLRGAELEELIERRPAQLVWAAYGNLIPSSLLDAAGGRAINVHASLLPRWRGAAPVAHALLAGDRETGITLMQGTASLDAGPILGVSPVTIDEVENAGELTARLATLGGAVLERELPRYLSGELPALPQDEGQVAWAPKVTSADGVLDLSRPADELVRRVRAMTPDPGASLVLRGQRLLVTRASIAGGRGTDRGTLELRDGVPHVAAGAGWLRLDEVRPPGRKTMSGAAWARGLPRSRQAK